MNKTSHMPQTQCTRKTSGLARADNMSHNSWSEAVYSIRSGSKLACNNNSITAHYTTIH